MGALAGEAPADAGWYGSGTIEEDQRREVFGFDKDTLLIGGLVGGGIARGVLLLTGDDEPSDTPPSAITAIDLASTDGNGSSTTDNITNKTDGLTISGIASSGARVELFGGASVTDHLTIQTGPEDYRYGQSCGILSRLAPKDIVWPVI